MSCSRGAFLLCSPVFLAKPRKRGSVQQFLSMIATRRWTTLCAIAVLAGFFAVAGTRAAIAQEQPATAGQTPAQPGSTQPSSPSVPAYREVTDEVGRTIRIPQSIHRIVSLAPSLTETLYALGLGDLVVGDTDYCDFPPDAQTKPKVGGVINPSLEAIAALHPDLVVATKTMNRHETVTALEDIGIPSYATDPRSLADIFASTYRLGDLLGAAAAAEAGIKDLEHRLSDIQQHVASYPPRRVLFVVWPQPLISIGKNTFIADALIHAGAVSVVNAGQDWPQISLEDVVHQQPDYLIFVESHSQAPPPELQTLADLPGWRALDAVKLHHYVLMSELVDRPSVRIVSAIEDLARKLHPEAFVPAPEAGKDGASLQPGTACEFQLPLEKRGRACSL
jgi:iron complex transport system substrate-binding protein